MSALVNSDGWQASERRYLSEGSMALLDTTTTTTADEVPPVNRTPHGMINTTR
jgi:hypothetical protein